jgi:hypothetical protein
LTATPFAQLPTTVISSLPGAVNATFQFVSLVGRGRTYGIDTPFRNCFGASSGWVGAIEGTEVRYVCNVVNKDTSGGGYDCEGRTFGRRESIFVQGQTSRAAEGRAAHTCSLKVPEEKSSDASLIDLSS